MTTLGFDTETKGLRWFDPDEQAFLISWADETGSFVCSVNDAEGVAAFRAAVDRADRLVAHNLPFDVHQVREAIGLDLLDTGKSCIDTNILARVVLPERAFGADSGYKLKDLAKTYLRADAQKAEDTIAALAKSAGIKLKSTGGYFDTWRAYPEEMEHYALLDAEYARDLLPKLEAKLTPKLGPSWDLERTLSPILVRAEQRGVKVDPEVVARLRAEYEPLEAKHRAAVEAELGDVDLGSPVQLREALLEHGVPLTRKTPKGELATDKFALAAHREAFPVIGELEAWRQASKMLSTYIGPMTGRDTVHPSFWQIGTWTSRMSCIAEGSYVDAPRDLLAHPRGIPIEDVAVGSRVYSFDADGAPRPRRVLAKTYQGRKRVLRLVWRAAGNKSYLGELKATPDHLVRLRDGSYRRMDELAPGDQLAFLSRQVVDGYARIGWRHGTGDGVRASVDEHRWLCPYSEVAHHVNENSLDNSDTNLVAMTRSAHNRHHAYERPRPLKPCPFTDEEMREAAQQGIVKFCRRQHCDAKTARRWAAEAGTAFRDMRRRDLMPTNHHVVAVVDDGETLPTWDLTIEGTPNFVVNEIGVHNCSNPNMQNLPARGEVGDTKLREVFVPREGHAFLVYDYDSIEIRLLAYYLNHAGYRQMIQEGLDPHAWMASNIWGGEVADYHKGTPGEKQRSIAKNVLFAIVYGAGARRVSDMLGVPYVEARELVAKIKDSLPRYYDLKRRIDRKIKTQGFINTMYGRRQIVSKDKSYVGMNALIQGTAAEVFKQGVLNVWDATRHLDVHPILFVHDELVLECPIENVAEAQALVEPAMCEAVDLTPALAVGGAVCTKSYAEAK